MRRLTFAMLLFLALGMASVAPALASNGQGHQEKSEVWCSIHRNQPEIDGTVTVPDGTQGSIVLSFYGSKDGKSWVFTGQTRTLHLVQGQTTYGFSFLAGASAGFNFFRVDGDDNSHSRSIDRDECGFRVPEAPATPLLLLGAVPAAALIAIKAHLIRLPLPHLHRIV
jgi:hypothetical protein